MRGEVFLVYLKFGDEKGQAPLEKLRKLARRWFPLAVQRLVIVDNALPGDFERELRQNTDLISGDNIEREFSGYEKGLQFLARRYGIDAHAPVIVANDTFLSSYGGASFLNEFTLTKVRVGLALGALIGNIDMFPEPVQWEGRNLQSWVRTSLMVARWEILQELLPLSLPWEDKDLFGTKDNFFAAKAPLGASYREFIETWLFRPPTAGSSFKESWHSKQPLNDDNLASMRAKARCIFCEHQLSLRASQKGVPLFDPRHPLRAVSRAIGLNRSAIPRLLLKAAVLAG